MKNYDVVVPVAGHIYISVEAEGEQEAIQKAMEASFRLLPMAWDKKEREYSIDFEYELLEKVNEGNVCYAPSPWEAEAEEGI